MSIYEMMSWMNTYKVWIIIGSVVWILAGIYSLRWTAMGLIGFHNSPVGFWMVVLFVILGPFYYVVLAIGLVEKIKFKKKDNRKLYRYVGTDSVYELLGEGFEYPNATPLKDGMMLIAVSKGAGTSKMEENLHLYKDKGPGGSLYYKGFTPDDVQKVFYRDIETNKVYHRTKKDFADRMRPKR